MLFLTTVEFFLSSISFKALIVVNNFRNVRGWAPNRSREPGNENLPRQVLFSAILCLYISLAKGKQDRVFCSLI